MMTGSSFGEVHERSRATRTLDDPDTFFSSDLPDINAPESPLVMVIDDSICVRRVVEIGLMRVGISAKAYPDGLAALQALENGEVTPPRVLLLDIGMPRLNGYEVARLIRNHPECAMTRIIMISGHDGVLDQMRSRLSGATDFIAKPFRAGELVKRVRRALGLFDPGMDWPE